MLSYPAQPQQMGPGAPDITVAHREQAKKRLLDELAKMKRSQDLQKVTDHIEASVYAKSSSLADYHQRLHMKIAQIMSMRKNRDHQGSRQQGHDVTQQQNYPMGGMQQQQLPVVQQQQQYNQAPQQYQQQQQQQYPQAHQPQAQPMQPQNQLFQTEVVQQQYQQQGDTGGDDDLDAFQDFCEVLLQPQQQQPPQQQQVQQHVQQQPQQHMQLPQPQQLQQSAFMGQGGIAAGQQQQQQVPAQNPGTKNLHPFLPGSGPTAMQPGQAPTATAQPTPNINPFGAPAPVQRQPGPPVHLLARTGSTPGQQYMQQPGAGMPGPVPGVHGGLPQQQQQQALGMQGQGAAPVMQRPPQMQQQQQQVKSPPPPQRAPGPTIAQLPVQLLQGIQQQGAAGFPPPTAAQAAAIAASAAQAMSANGTVTAKDVFKHLPMDQLTDLYWRLQSQLRLKYLDRLRAFTQKHELQVLNTPSNADQKQVIGFQKRLGQLRTLCKVLENQRTDPGAESMEINAEALVMLQRYQKGMTKFLEVEGAKTLGTEPAAAAAGAGTPGIAAATPPLGSLQQQQYLVDAMAGRFSATPPDAAAALGSTQQQQQAAEPGSQTGNWAAGAAKAAAAASGTAGAAAAAVSPDPLARVLRLLVGPAAAGSSSSALPGTSPSPLPGLPAAAAAPTSAAAAAAAPPLDSMQLARLQGRLHGWLQAQNMCPPIPRKLLPQLLQQLPAAAEAGPVPGCVVARCTTTCRESGPADVSSWAMVAHSPDSFESQQTGGHDLPDAATAATATTAAEDDALSSGGGSDVAESRKRQRSQEQWLQERVEELNEVDARLAQTGLRLRRHHPKTRLETQLCRSGCVLVECVVDPGVPTPEQSALDHAMGAVRMKVETTAAAPVGPTSGGEDVSWHRLTIQLSPSYPATPAIALFSSSDPTYHSPRGLTVRTSFLAELEYTSRGSSLEDLACLWRDTVKTVAAAVAGASERAGRAGSAAVATPAAWAAT